MTTQETTPKLDIKKALPVIYTVLVLGLIGKLSIMVVAKRSEYNVTRTAAICPALFSISRSARDTLIVMKAEPLCNNYVLTNLK
jgi:hypothetical protein